MVDELHLNKAFYFKKGEGTWKEVAFSIGLRSKTLGRLLPLLFLLPTIQLSAIDTYPKWHVTTSLLSDHLVQVTTSYLNYAPLLNSLLACSHCSVLHKASGGIR